MIVCHCNVLTCRHVREAIETVREREGPALVTPGVVFRENAKRPRCGCCMMQIHNLIEEHLIANNLPHGSGKAKTIIQGGASQVELQTEDPSATRDLTPPALWNNSKL